MTKGIIAVILAVVALLSLAGCDLLEGEAPVVVVVYAPRDPYVYEDVYLTAEASHDPSGGSITFTWELVSAPLGGGSETLSVLDPFPYAVLTPTDGEGVYTIRVTASNGTLSATAEVSIYFDPGWT